MIGVRVSLTVAQKEVFHFQHTNYTHHPNVSWGARTGRWVLVHFDGNSFKAIVSVGYGHRKWGPVIEHLLVCTESMLKGGNGHEVWFVDGERSGRDEETRANVVSCRTREAKHFGDSTQPKYRKEPPPPPTPPKKSRRKQTNKNVSRWQIPKTIFAHVCPV